MLLSNKEGKETKNFLDSLDSGIDFRAPSPIPNSFKPFGVNPLPFLLKPYLLENTKTKAKMPFVIELAPFIGDLEQDFDKWLRRLRIKMSAEVNLSNYKEEDKPLVKAMFLIGQL
jgi:hypothetical protein